MPLRTDDAVRDFNPDTGKKPATTEYVKKNNDAWLKYADKKDYSYLHCYLLGAISGALIMGLVCLSASFYYGG